MPGRFRAICHIFLAGAGILYPALAGDPGRWQADTYVYYSTGEYGDGEDTRILYAPVILERSLKAGELSVTIPYLSIDAPAGTVVVDGQAQAGEGDGRTEEGGLGDISLKASYPLTMQEGFWPWIDGVVRVKLPTADEDKGLGTGEPDFAFGLEAVRSFAGSWFGFFDVFYTFIGDPDYADYHNRVALSPGLGRMVSPELLLAAFYEYSTAISSGDDPQAVSFLLQRALRKNLKVYTMFDLGLSDGAADYGLLAGGSLRF